MTDTTNCPTAGKTETERGLQRREAVTSASSSGTCGSLPRSGRVVFVIRAAGAERGPPFLRIGSPVRMRGICFGYHASLPRCIPFSHVWGCYWPRSGHLGLVTRRRRGTCLAPYAYMPLLICAGWRLDMGLICCSVDPVHHADAAHAFGRRDSATSGP